MACNSIQSSSITWKHDVFVSFRGDTCNNFTDHVFGALHRKGIVTFRDHNIQLLNDDNAFQLFCRKAFKCDDIMGDYRQLTYDALEYAKGLPLAIEVLGSFLHGRNVSEWRSALVRLRENPMTNIMNVLRISFDGLEDMEKEIFLVSVPNNIVDLSSLEGLNLSGCPKLLNNQLLEKPRHVKHLKMSDTSETAINCQLASSICKMLMLPIHFFNSWRHEDFVGLLWPSLPSFPCLRYLGLSFCNLLQNP